MRNRRSSIRNHRPIRASRKPIRANRRPIKAMYIARDEEYELLSKLENYGVTTDTILDHMLDWFSGDEVVECLKDLCRDCDIDLIDDEDEEDW